MIGALVDGGVRAAPILISPPSWANFGDEHTAPLGDTNWAAFAHWFAARYGSNGSFWNGYQGTHLPVETYEIWNEPNLKGRFKLTINTMCNALTADADQPGPQRYGSLFKSAYEAIKLADPNSIVMVGGLDPRRQHNVPHDGDCTVREFLSGAKAHMPGITPDAIGIHEYNATSTSTGSGSPTWTQRARSRRVTYISTRPTS